MLSTPSILLEVTNVKLVEVRVPPRVCFSRSWTTKYAFKFDNNKEFPKTDFLRLCF